MVRKGQKEKKNIMTYSRVEFLRFFQMGCFQFWGSLFVTKGGEVVPVSLTKTNQAYEMDIKLQCNDYNNSNEINLLLW